MGGLAGGHGSSVVLFVGATGRGSVGGRRARGTGFVLGVGLVFTDGWYGALVLRGELGGGVHAPEGIADEACFIGGLRNALLNISVLGAAPRDFDLCMILRLLPRLWNTLTSLIGMF